MEFSRDALITLMRSRERVNAVDIFRRILAEKKTMIGIMENKISVRGTLMLIMIAKEPISITAEINRSSGPWCASSAISIRSVMMRDMIEPVL